VHRDPHQRCLDRLVASEGGVEIGGVEVGEPVPQCEVRRGGLLSLQRDHAMYRVGDTERLAPQQ
jgi:hypothetical protein